MIILPCGTKKASEEMIHALISIGALYMDENGIHASEPETYPLKKLSLPTTNHNRDNGKH